MVKKSFAILLVIIAVLFTFTACIGGGKRTVDEQSADAAVRIELKDSKLYFNLPELIVVMPELTNKDTILEDYISKATSEQKLPQELVNSYVESFKEYFGTESAGSGINSSADSSADKDELTLMAESLIKTEMVIYLAFTNLQCEEIKEADREAMAEKMARETGANKDAFYTAGGDSYLVDSAIREERVTAKLQALWDKENAATSSEEAVESADETSEASEASEE